MSQIPSLPRASFWRESLRALLPTLRSEWRWVVCFVLLMATAHSVSHQLLAGFDPKTIKENPSLFLVPFLQSMAIIIAPIIPANFIFTVLFLRREVKRDPPELTLMLFVFWLWKSMEKYVLLFAPVLAVTALGFLIDRQVSQIDPAQQTLFEIPVKEVLALGALLPQMLIFILFFYVSLRLWLVTPLAVLRRRPVIRSTWALTHHQVWRLLTGAFAQHFIVFVCFLIPFVLEGVAVSLWGEGSVAVQFASALLGGIWGLVVGLASVIYACTACRILLHEQENNRITTQS